MHRLRFGTSDFKLIEPKTVPRREPSGWKSSWVSLRNLCDQEPSELCAELKAKGIEFACREGIRRECALPWSKTRTETSWNSLSGAERIRGRGEGKNLLPPSPE